MNLSGNYIFKAPPDAVWPLLIDPRVMADAIPGSVSLTPTDNQLPTWDYKINVTLPFVQGLYIGCLSIEQQIPLTCYTLAVSNHQSHTFDGKLHIQLTWDEQVSQTKLTWHAETTINANKLPLSQTIIHAFAEMLSNRFFIHVAGRINRYDTP